MPLKLRILLLPFLAMVFSFFTTVAQAQNAYLDAGLPVPAVTSDKDDYAPGEVAHITGTGWTKDQQVHVEFKEEPDYPDFHIYDVNVDAEGNWKIDYQVENRHLGVKFTVTADGKQSGFRATHVFTDAGVESVVIGSQVGALTYGTGGSVTFPITVNGKGSFSVSLAVSGLPTNTTATFTTNPVVISVQGQGSSSGTSTLTITTANNSPVPTGAFTVTATNTPSPGNTASNNTGTLIIGKKNLTISGVTANNKVYNSLTTATLNTSSATLVGIVSEDAVSLGSTGAVGTFVDKNAGNGKTVTTSGFTISGTAVGNYSLIQPSTTANITTLAITGNISVNNKTYDGNTTATIATRTLSGIISGDAATYTGGTATFTDKNVGTAKLVNAIGLSLTGTDAGNYSINSMASTTANIAAKGLTITGITASSKPYDRTTTANLTGTASLNGVIAGDAVSLNTASVSALFSDKTVAANKPVTVSGYTLAGNDAGNYTLAQPAGLTASITALGITGAITAANKIYDGNTTATIATRSLNGVVSGDAVTYTGGSATFANAAAATNKTVTATGLSLTGGDAANYSVNTTATATADITPKSVTGSITASNKVYNGNTSATISGRSLTGVLTADASNVSLAGGTAAFADKNVGTGKTVTATGLNLSGTSAGNYSLSSATATTTANITPLALTPSVAANDKPYDGTTTATLSSQTVGGVVGTESVSLHATAANFNAANVGNGLTVTATGLSLTGADAGNYTVASSATTTANITAKSLVPAVSAINKVYNGNTTATLSSQTLSGVIAGDKVTLNVTTASFADKNVGTDKTVTATGLTLGGSDKSNYSLSTTTTSTTADITALGITGVITANNKVYDGNTNATIVTRSLTGVITGDDVNYTAGNATFANKNVGTGKNVSVAGITITGADAGNYTLTSTAAQATAAITSLTISGSVTASDKVYDGGTGATIATRSLTGSISGDDISLSGGTAAFANKNVGSGKPVNATGLSLAGADAGNYTLASTTANTTANITALAITGSITASNKVYDATTGAAVATRALTGAVSGDDIAYTGGIAHFDTRHVGTGKTVTAAGLGLAGTDAGNYIVNDLATATADITPRAMTLSITADDKIYDGTVNATVAASIASGFVIGDNVTPAAANGTFNNKNVGTAKPVIADLSISGADAGNYSLTAANAATTASITAKNIVVSAAGIDKVYDAATAATVNLSDDRVAGDVLDAGYTNAAFNDKNVGTAKPVSVSGISISGTDAANYTANTTAATTASITAASLTVTATGLDKVYDGNATAGITLSDNRIGADVLTLAYINANFDNKNVGAGKAVAVSGISISGTDAGNYNLSSTTAHTSADINPLSISGNITANDKVYNGNTTAAIATRTLVGAVAGDDVSLVGGSAAFEDKNVGNNKTVAANGLGLNGGDAGNYSLASSTAATTASITPLQIEGTITAADKIYDGTAAATITTRTLTGVVSGDVVAYTGGTATFENKNAGNDKTVTGNGLGLTGDDAANYTVNTTAATTATISPKVITGSITAGDKVYDGNNTATLLTRTLDGVIGNDEVTYINGAATFNDKTVANGKTVTGAGLSLSGKDAPNYSVNTIATTLADITAKAITGSITADNKVYNGNTTAIIVSRSLTGVIGSDDVTYTGGTALFDNKNVGNGKTVAANGLSLSGADAANYTVNSSAATTANITALGITGTFTASNKVYDGNEHANIVTRSLTGVIPGDAVQYTGGSATFANKTVGVDKTVTAGGFLLTGADAGNYTVNTSGTVTASITPLGITGTITAQNKVYDGNATANASGLLSGVLSGDVVTVQVSNALFSDKNAGTAKQVIASLTLIGGDAANYSVNSTAGTTADITPKTLTGSITASNKVYDGITAAAIASRTLAGVIAPDVVSYTGGSADFSDKNIGNGKAVTATGLSLSGADATNYTVNEITATTANITARPASVTPNAGSKVYGTDDPVLTGTLSGFVAADGISVVYSRTAGQTVAGSPYTISAVLSPAGALGNYTITYNTAVFTINAASAVASVTVNPSTQQYSDKVSFTAKIQGGASLVSGQPQAAQTAIFKVGTQVMGTAPFVASGSDLIAVLTDKALVEGIAGQLAPGAKTVTATVTGASTNYSINNLNPTISLTVNKEDADVTYSGLTYFSTASSTSSTAQVTLSATISDNADGNRGDIRNARVTFRRGSINGTVLGTGNLQPVLVTIGDATVGTVTSTFTYNLSSVDFANKGTSFEVYAVVDNYYTGSNNGDPGMVTVSVPGNDAVTGGGYLNMTNSIGKYAGTAGTKTNFGFTMKYAKSGGSAKGQCNIIVRSNNKIYQIKSNAINSLSVGGTTASGTPANFVTKANLTDITNPLLPVSLGGNLDLYVNLNDVSAGGQSDQVSILLQNGATILYASNWNGSKTVLQTLGGGNVSVRSAALSALAVNTRQVPAALPEGNFTDLRITASPNPSTSQFTLKMESSLRTPMTLLIRDNFGKLLEVRRQLTPGQTVQLGANYAAGVYYAELQQGNSRKVVQLLKLRD